MAPTLERPCFALTKRVLGSVGIVCLLLLGGSFPARAESTVEIPKKLNLALRNVGINLTGDWTFSRKGVYPGNRDDEIDTVIRDGFHHVVFIVSVDEFFNLNCGEMVESCLNQNIVKLRINLIAYQIRELSQKYADVGFVISAKSDAYVGGINAPVHYQTVIYKALEERKEIQAAYINLWTRIAELTADIPTDTLAFNLMNEPEWHTFAGGLPAARDVWLDLAETMIDKIREITPNRIVIVEGIDKAIAFWPQGKTPDTILKPLNRSGVFYAFHFYDPFDWTHQKTMAAHPLEPWMKKMVSIELKAFVAYAKNYNIPVLLTEIGVWGPYFENGAQKSGATAQARAEWARILADALLPNGIGLTWWGLHQNNTPYVSFIQGENTRAIQPKLVRDDLLWKALRLHPRAD